MKKQKWILVCIVLLLMSPSGWAQKNEKAAETKAAPLKVAFVVSEGFTLIDLAGPWDVFNSARIPVAGVVHPPDRLFGTYTVSNSMSPVSMGSTSTRLIPDYTFENVPKPDIIVVGAQDWRKEVPGLSEWLKKENAQDITIMSVCVGAGQLADAGLLDGKRATTHHAFIKDFRAGYPKTNWLEGKRFVKVTDTLWTSGGLTSGIDLALKLVAVRFGGPAAEFTRSGWNTPALDGSKLCGIP